MDKEQEYSEEGLYLVDALTVDKHTNWSLPLAQFAFISFVQAKVHFPAPVSASQNLSDLFKVQLNCSATYS